MYYSLHTQQWEECPLDPQVDCGRETCEGCPCGEDPAGYGPEDAGPCPHCGGWECDGTCKGTPLPEIYSVNDKCAHLRWDNEDNQCECTLGYNYCSGCMFYTVIIPGRPYHSTFGAGWNGGCYYDDIPF